MEGGDGQGTCRNTAHLLRVNFRREREMISDIIKFPQQQE